jgi:hypothetical protein
LVAGAPGHIWVVVAKARPGLDWAAFHFNPPGEIQLY